MEITLRPAVEADMEFLFALQRAAMGEYIAATWGPWDDARQRDLFWRHTRLEIQQVVESRGKPIGCLAIEDKPDEVYLQRIYLLPDVQSRGLGTNLVRQVIADAGVRPIRLRCLRVNPAGRLYERLGFRVVGETKTHYQMVRAGSGPHGSGTGAPPARPTRP